MFELDRIFMEGKQKDYSQKDLAYRDTDFTAVFKTDLLGVISTFFLIGNVNPIELDIKMQK